MLPLGLRGLYRLRVFHTFQTDVLAPNINTFLVIRAESPRATTDNRTVNAQREATYMCMCGLEWWGKGNPGRAMYDMHDRNARATG